LPIAERTSEFIRNNMRILSLVTFIVGVLFFIISLAGLFESFASLNKSVFEDINNALDRTNDGGGNWQIWVFLLSLMGWIVGLGYHMSYYFNAKKFHKLTDTASKATFVRNQDEIELLAFKLGDRYEDIVDELRIELKIRR